MTAAEDQVRRVVSLQASDWFVANQGGALDAIERAAFVAWLKASPLHVEEYLGIALVARDLRAAADDSAASLDLLLEEAAADESTSVVTLDRAAAPEPVHTPRRLNAGWPLAAIAAGVVISLATLLWSSGYLGMGGSQEVHRTAHGEQSVLKLPDGSTLHLNTDSEVAVRYSRSDRAVELRRGEVLFDVARDSTRPFRVQAGSARVVAVGTRFDVYRKLSSTVLTVAHGQVDVVTGKMPAVVGGSASTRTVQRVAAGYQLHIDDVTGSAQPVRVDVKQTLGWLQRKIAFENRPLGEVADEFNRYAKIPFKIDDASLSAMRVSGVFDAYDTDSFIAFLQTFEGVRVETTPARTLIRRVTTTGQRSQPPID